MATQRVVALVDMDCFYCQVEARLNPTLIGKPVAVVQYNQWKGGGIIAVNYEARDLGVSRYMRGSDAKAKCPEIVLVSVPTVRGKADLTKYRDAGAEVAQVFSLFSDCVQRASIDEAYIDITKAVDERIKNGLTRVTEEDLPYTFVLGFSELKSNNDDARLKGLKDWLKVIETEKSVDSADFKLAVGGLIIEEMRAEILKKTGFHCSAGVAHNKILAKLAAGLHKPQRQTVLPHDSVPELYDTLPVNKVRSLGGKMGKLVADRLKVSFMSELYKFSLTELQQKVDDKTGTWLYNIARGIDLDPVTPRLIPDSIGCCKNFPGKNALDTRALVDHWARELATEIAERLAKDQEQNRRRARLVTVSFCQDTPMSRSGPLTAYTSAAIAGEALALLAKFNSAPSNSDAWLPAIKYMGISVGKFAEEQTSIGKYLQPRTQCGSEGRKQPLVDDDTEPCSKYFKQPTATEKQSSFFMSFLQKTRDVSAEVGAEAPVEDVGEGPSTQRPEELCSQCGKRIPLQDFPEHADYHAAVALQAEINKKPASSATQSNSPEKHTAKRKRGKCLKTTDKKLKSISSFFTVLPK